MSKLTKRIAEVCVEGFQPAIKDAWKYTDVYLASDVDALLSPPGEGLTREQVQTYCNEIDKCIEDLCGSGRVNSDYLLEHDAAQRVEIARLKELLQRRSRIGDEDRALAVRLQAEVEGVRLEHSALTAKVQGWRVCIAELCGHPLSDPLINVIDPIALVATLTQQLAAREGQYNDLIMQEEQRG